jgi:hypothetical protein
MVPIEVTSMFENTCWEDLDLIFRKTVGVWTWASRPFDL